MSTDSFEPNKAGIVKAPQTIGVYLFCGTKKDEYLYIGKSINVRARLLSHLESARLDERERIIFEGSKNIRVIPADSEFQALLLEAQLIQKYKPRYNRAWKDDKSYLYIKVETRETYPKIRFVRREYDGRSRYFGPFSSARVAERILKEIRRVIPFCMQAKVGRAPCFYAKIGLCNPCPSAIEGLKDTDEKEAARKRYRRNIFRIMKILEGKTEPVVKELYRDLKTLTKQERYEEALVLRNRILRFERLVTQHVGLEREPAIEGRREDSLESLLKVLQRFFPRLSSLHRIECYDMSNLSFKQATASMVVATDGLIDKSQYRKFRIRNLKSSSDFEMIAETIQRRFRNSWPEPDLLVIDGGKPQVRTVLATLMQLNRNTPVIGIAKRPDRLVMGVPDLPGQRLPLRHPGFNLIRALRDESHRFAKKYHTELRQRALLP